MRSLTPIKKGDEIFNDYGPLPRSDLLRRYGYVTDRYAAYDVVEIFTDLVIDVLVKCTGVAAAVMDMRVGNLSTNSKKNSALTEYQASSFP